MRKFLYRSRCVLLSPVPIVATRCLHSTMTQPTLSTNYTDLNDWKNNPSLFKTIKLVSLRVPTNTTSLFSKNKNFLKFTLERPRLNKVITTADPSSRFILLKEEFENVEEAEKSLEPEFGKLIRDIGARFEEYELKLGRECLNMTDILKLMLPPDVPIPTSFETIGHIAHLNLRPQHDPYKKFIGEVLLDRNSHIRTVVNKVGEISSEFRVFQMELLAGEDNMEAQVKEANCKFFLNLSEVYWNSKLQFEHQRLVNSFAPGDVICDMFCGIGPFVIPAAKKGHICHANDLNPKSVSYLKRNIGINNVGKLISVYNMDARDFFRLIRKQEREGKIRPSKHFVMNLPASAADFLDVFVGAYSENEELPRIHCYSFAKDIDSCLKEISEKMGTELTKSEVSIHQVRNISPHKWMYCVSFTVPQSVCSKKRKLGNQEELDDIDDSKRKTVKSQF